MKSLYLALLATLLAAFSLPAYSQSGDQCHTGSWYEYTNPGEGLSVEVLENQTIAYWYTADGWYFLQGEDSESLRIYENFGGKIYDVGRATISFTSDDDAYFIYDFQLWLPDTTAERPVPWCLRTDCEGEIPLVRLTQHLPCE